MARKRKISEFGIPASVNETAYFPFIQKVNIYWKNYKVSIVGLLGIFNQNTKDGIVATVGGGQENAIELTCAHNIVDSVASINDSVKCDLATVGKVREVFNYGANDLDLYPAIGERFRCGADFMDMDAPLVISTGNSIKLVCYSEGIWRF